MKCPNCSIGIVNENETCGMCGIEFIKQPEDNFAKFFRIQKKRRTLLMIIIPLLLAIIIITAIIGGSYLFTDPTETYYGTNKAALIISVGWAELYYSTMGDSSCVFHVNVTNLGEKTAFKENITIRVSYSDGYNRTLNWKGEDIHPEESAYGEYGFVPAFHGRMFISVYYVDEPHDYSMLVF
jgi:hypothetical protein